MKVNFTWAVVFLLSGGLSSLWARSDGAGVTYLPQQEEIHEGPVGIDPGAEHAPQEGLQKKAEPAPEAAAVIPEMVSLKPVSCGVEKVCNMVNDGGKLCQQRYNVNRCPCGRVFFKTLKDFSLMSTGVEFNAFRHYFLDTSAGALEAVKERREAVQAMLREMQGKKGKSAREKYNDRLRSIGYPIYGKKDIILLSLDPKHLTNRNGRIDAPGFFLAYAQQLSEWQNILEQVNKTDKASKVFPLKPGMAKMQDRFNKFNAKPGKAKAAIEVEKAYTEMTLDSYENCGLPVKLMYDYFGNMSFKKVEEGGVFPPKFNKPLGMRFFPQVKFSGY
ncbi:MAG: hypothetical protein AB7V08_13535 [Elusimicrobiales bacterium]